MQRLQTSDTLIFLSYDLSDINQGKYRIEESIQLYHARGANRKVEMLEENLKGLLQM